MGRRSFGRARKLPSGRWQARYPDGSGRDVPAPMTFATKADASRFLAQMQSDIAHGLWRDPRLGQISFADWAEQWLASNPAKRATTLARDSCVLRTHFIPALGNRQLASITPLHIRAVVDAMAARLAPATMRTNVGVLRAVFNAAVESDLIARSPVRAIRLKSGEKRNRPTLTPEELYRLAGAVGPSYRALVLVAGGLGLRWSEAIGLRIADVNFRAGTLTVNQTISEVEGRLEVAETKTGASRRTLSVPKFLLDELTDHLSRQRGEAHGEDLVFVSAEGGPLRRSFAYRTFIPAVAAAELDPDVTFHGLRHVATSLMVEAGEHPRVIQHRLGHATARLSMELYAHVPEAADREAANHLDARFTKGTGTQRARGTGMEL